MFGRVPKNVAAFLGTRPNMSESHSEISTRVPFCIAAGRADAGHFERLHEHAREREERVQQRRLLSSPERVARRENWFTPRTELAHGTPTPNKGEQRPVQAIPPLLAAARSFQLPRVKSRATLIAAVRA